MPADNQQPIGDPVREALVRYDESLLRQVAANLIRPRNQWPVEDLIERCVQAIDNAALIDRRIREQNQACRQLLAAMARSRHGVWRVAHLVEILGALGHSLGIDPVIQLCQQGLLYPVLNSNKQRIKHFQQWLVQTGNLEARALVPSLIADRALGETPTFALDEQASTKPLAVFEADGLDWLLRLAVMWQQLAEAPLRRTQQEGFFKRDLERVRADLLLAREADEPFCRIPDPGLLTVELARMLGIVEEANGELHSAKALPAWEEGVTPAIGSLWSALLEVRGWDAASGWQAEQADRAGPSAYVIALLLLASWPEDGWAPAARIAERTCAAHPYWNGNGSPTTNSHGLNLVNGFLLGVAYSLGLVQVGKSADGWLVRLSQRGRWLLRLGEVSSSAAHFPKTLLVQPNLEIVVYRQGLTPALISSLSQFAVWKTIGSACTLQLKPESVYQGLEAGWTLERMIHVLEHHGMRPTPTPVLESLRTWANKRNRLTVFANAALFEFASGSDLEEALARGLPAIRMTDRLAAVANENSIDYRHFRLLGTRDYGLPPDRCIQVEEDGVTLTIDAVRADLLLETELCRFADYVDGTPNRESRRYRLSFASLARARDAGLGASFLEEWFTQRTGQNVPPAARLLMEGTTTASPWLRRELVLRVESKAVADGLLQWPATRQWIAQRLGPMALVVEEDSVEPLRAQLEALGIALKID
jgi:hypothetical protein